MRILPLSAALLVAPTATDPNPPTGIPRARPIGDVRPVAALTPAFQLVEHTGPSRVLAEKFIHKRFADAFGARIEAFMPRLFCMYNADVELCGALGLRSARHRLYLEHYLEQPIEATIAQDTGATVERSSIMEVGHLSGAFPGAMRTLIWLLADRLAREGYEWVAFTGTVELRNAFRRNGLDPIDVGAAKRERLPKEVRSAWGSYYDHAPRVFVGRVQDGVRSMQVLAGESDARSGSMA